MSEEGLHAVVDRASNGDPVAVEALLVRHLPGLTAYLHVHAGSLVTGRESISDLAQSVCLEALQSMENFDYRGEPAFRKWLCELAISKIRGRRRKLLSAKRNPAREVRLEDVAHTDVSGPYASFLSPSQVAMGKEELELVAEAFKELAADHQEVITMSRIFGMSHAEISQETGRSEGAARVLLHRALAKLAAIMKSKQASD